jgi:two-component system LytT family response regulator
LTCRSDDDQTVRVLIADDESVARKGLRALLAAEPDVAVVGEAATGEETEALLRSTEPDVLILDIQMPQKTGLDVVAGIDPAALPLVIFVTAHDEHAIRAFELHALDYLVKPYREDRLREAIGRARALMDRRSAPARSQRREQVASWVAAQPAYPSRIRVEDRGRIRFIPVRDIQWIEAQDYCVLLHLAAERILRRGTLKQCLRTLDPAMFVRVHRSAAINVRQVRELTIAVGGGLTARLVGGAEVAVARSCRAELEERLAALP